MPEIPYPLPPRGPIRQISERLELGTLNASSAYDLSAMGIDWKLIAPHVHDIEWWRKQELSVSAPAKLRWNIRAWDATLQLCTSDLILWIDPGPQAPIPPIAPELVIVTHAHADHVDRLFEWMERFPDLYVVMTPLTAQLISLRDTSGNGYSKVLERAIKVNFNETRTLLGVTLQFLPAGHLIGAAMVEIGFGPDLILVTGDFSLREVGGLPGATIPDGDYAFILLEGKECGKRTLPFADLRSTRMPFLNEVKGIIEKNPSIVQINAQSFGQAQEAYAALVMSQRAGAFSESSICLDGMTANVSSLYESHFKQLTGPWNIPYAKETDTNSEHKLIITSKQKNDQQAVNNLLERPSLYTHAGWAEKMAFAVRASCQQVLYYHGGVSTSLDVALIDVGRKTSAIRKEFLL